MPQPVSYFNERVDVLLNQGPNVLAVRMVAGRFGAVLAMAGPEELRKGKVNAKQDDPLLRGDVSWTSLQLTAPANEPAPADIAERLEPFVDSYLIDTMQGDMQHRLHHPQPREIVLDVKEPWGNQIAYPKMLEHEGMFMLYYRASRTKDHPDDKYLETTLLATSEDGIHFSRSQLTHLQVSGHSINNAVFKDKASHNFSPFVDTNPAAPAHQKFKAVGHHPQGSGIAAYASADGLVWELMSEERIIDYHFGGFDSQNIAFWDATRGCYFCYFRGATDMWHARVRSITVATSQDMIHWTNHRDLKYSDDRLWGLYLNAITPYVRAPHLFVGTPARFMPYRKKIDSHTETGVSDALLMSSRDGVNFHHWTEAFVRPSLDALTWTDRNQFPLPSIVQTGAGELSMYWTEHTRYPSRRIRRGVLMVLRRCMRAPTWAKY